MPERSERSQAPKTIARRTAASVLESLGCLNRKEDALVSVSAVQGRLCGLVGVVPAALWQRDCSRARPHFASDKAPRMRLHMTKKKR